VKLSARARADLAALRRHYRHKGRPEAAQNVSKAMREAEFKISMGWSVPAPRPYPHLQTKGRAWVHAGHYWVLHTTTSPVIAIADFHDTADIPNRL
jgi:plasmid stabilization system protein ParE